MAGVELLHAPPVGDEKTVEVFPTQFTSTPDISVGLLFTVTTRVDVQPVDSV